MNVPCMMGFKCIHQVHDEGGGPCCVYPWVVGTLTEERFEADAVQCEDMCGTECKLVEEGSDLDFLLSMANMYSQEEWASLMKRLSVHLERDARQDMHMTPSRMRRVAEGMEILREMEGHRG